MKTKLPTEIKSVEEAKVFLTELNNNHESYHPEDDAHEIDWVEDNEENDILYNINDLQNLPKNNIGEIDWKANTKPTKEECDLLNKLMDDIYDLPENTYDRKHFDLGFDPCGFLLYLDELKSLDVTEKDIYKSDFIKFKDALVKAGYKINKAIKDLRSHVFEDGIYMQVTFTCSNIEVKKLYLQICEHDPNQILETILSSLENDLYERLEGE